VNNLPTEDNEQNPLFKPIGKADEPTKRTIRVGNFKKELLEAAADLSDTDTTHPLEQESIQSFVAEEFPEYADAIKEVDIPRLSNNPDPLEKWEAARLTKRRARKDWEESDTEYLAKCLYEETYATNADAGKRMPAEQYGSCGITTGGLISHYLRDPISLQRMFEFDLDHPSFGACIRSFSSRRDRNQLINVVVTNSYPTNIPPMDAINEIGRVEPALRRRFEKNPNAEYDEGFDALGFRLLKLLKAKLEFFEPIEDPRLRELCKIEGQDVEITKIKALLRLWRKLSSVLFAGGGYKSGKSDGFKEAVEELLFLRTHPEMQILYKYLSPSGHLNEKE